MRSTPSVRKTSSNVAFETVPVATRISNREKFLLGEQSVYKYKRYKCRDNWALNTSYETIDVPNLKQNEA